MTIPTSTVPAVRGYLFDLLNTAMSGQGTQVYYSDPDDGYPQDVIYLGDTEQQLNREQMVGSGGAGWLYEAYHQVIEVMVFRGGDQARQVFERACALVGQIETLVRTDPSLGGQVITGYPAGTTYESGWDDDHMGRVTYATMRVAVESRL